MCNRLDLERTIAREKQRDLLCQAERERLIRVAWAGRRKRAKAGSRVWDWLKRWLDRLPVDGRAARRSRVEGTDLYLLVALAWTMAKE